MSAIRKVPCTGKLLRVRFRDALTENLPPERVGDVRFWYEDGQLWAERSRPSGLAQSPDLLLLGAVVAGLLGLVLLVLSPSDPLSFLLSALLIFFAAAAAWVASRLQLKGGRHRFVLDFAAERLTLERYSLGAGPARRYVIAFDDVTGVHAERLRKGSLELIVRFRHGRGHREEVLLPSVPAAEAEAFERMWRLLQNAFGLKDADAEGDVDGPGEVLPPDRFDPGRR